MGAENTSPSDKKEKDFIQIFKEEVSSYGSRKYPTHLLASDMKEYLKRVKIDPKNKNYPFYKGLKKLFSEHLTLYKSHEELKEKTQIISPNTSIQLERFKQPIKTLVKPPEEKKPVLGHPADNLDSLMKLNQIFFQESKSVINFMCSEIEPQLLKSLQIPVQMNPKPLELVKYPEENILLVQNDISRQEKCFNSDILLSVCYNNLFVRNPKEMNTKKLKDRIDTIMKFKENQDLNIVVIHKCSEEEKKKKENLSQAFVQEEVQKYFSEDLKGYKTGDQLYHIQYRKNAKIYHFYMDSKKEFKFDLKKLLLPELSLHRDQNFGDIFQKQINNLSKKIDYMNYFSSFGLKRFKNSLYVCQEDEYFQQEEMEQKQSKQFMLKVKCTGQYSSSRFIKHPFLQPLQYLQVELKEEKGLVTKGIYFDKAEYEGLKFKECKIVGECLYLIFDFCT